MATFIIRNKDIKTRCIDYIMKHVMAEPVKEVTIRDYKATRSLEQNALMWKWYTFFESLGNTKDETHEAMKKKWLRKHKDELNIKMALGEEVGYDISTTKFNVKTMTEFLNMIEQEAIENGVNLPPPEYYGYGWSNKEK